ncbi:hypothetical protein [Agrococcus jenensis]|uniref:Uncharacterized protein n=1 Tax=Agrococcus jenensis TaxID=46353 RepID=A0A3N2ARZ0_9MICO|nr:hypothetical protein [Agrococcus jenensis]ROR65810.1 hypothetical protein EDD26_1180 [Agrococcus jenensis]
MSFPPPPGQPIAWHPAAPPPQSRAPLPDVERRRLLRVGAASGALLGAGTGLGGVMVLFWLLILGMSAVFAPLVIAYDQGDPLQEAIAAVITPLTVAVLAVGTVLCLLGVALSWALLRRWGGGRALGVTAAGAAIAAVPVHGTNILIVLLSFVLQPDLDEATGIAVVALVAAFAGVGVGAAAGAGAWRWMGGALRPRR